MPKLHILTVDQNKVRKYNFAIRAKVGVVTLDQAITVIITDMCPGSNLVPQIIDDKEYFLGKEAITI
jgi:hypothetical protein